MTSNPDQMSRMDKTYAHMLASPESDTAGLRFYEAFCDTNLSVLVNADLSMQVFETSQGKIILAFDTEERVAEFVDQPTEFIKMPGRELVTQLRGTDTGIGLNLNVAPTSQILTPEILAWISELLSVDSTLLVDQVAGFSADCQLSAEDRTALTDRLANFAGRVEAAYLCGVTYTDGAMADALFIVDCDPTIEADLFTAMIETQKFAKEDVADLAIKFISSSSPALLEIRRHGDELHLPKPIVTPAFQPTAPGMDPDKPPKLR